MIERRSLLAAFLLPTLVGAQPVAYETRGETLASTLRALSASTGKPIEVDGTLANEIVILRTKPRPVEDLLRHLAGSVGGRLAPSNGGWRLSADLETQARQEAADTDRRREALRAKLAERQKQLADQPEFGEREARILVARLKEFHKSRNEDSMGSGAPYASLRAAAPDGRLLTRVLSGIGADALATIEPGRRVVFAERPNRLQRALPAMAPLANRYWTEYQPMADQVSGEEVAGFSVIAMPEQRPTRWLLEAKRGPFESGLELTLKGLDESGVVRTRTNADLTVSRLFNGAPPDAAADEKPFVFSPTVKRMLGEVAKSFLGGQSDVQFPEDVRGPLRDPVTNEPLSWWVADALFALAAREGRDLVACVPDLVLLPTLMMAAMEFESPKAGAFEAYLAAEAATLTRPEGCLVVAPRSFRWSRELRTDRRVLKRYLEAVSRGGADFLETARFVYGAPRAFSDSIAPYYLLLVAPDSMEALSSVSDHALLRIVGSLSPTQLASAGTGILLPIASFSPETRREAEAYVFGPYAEEATRNVVTGNQATDEPTERYAAGLPATLALAIAPSETSPVVRVGEEDPSRPPRGWEDPGNLRQRLGPNADAELARLRYRVGERTQVTVVLHYEPDRAASATFRLLRANDAEYRPFAALPEVVRHALTRGSN